MAPTFKYDFSSHGWKGTSSFSTGLFINNQFVDGVDGKTINVENPSTGTIIGSIAEATEKDIDLAVDAAQKAYDTAWGLKVPGHERGRLLLRLADLLEANIEELGALEAIDNGKALATAKSFDVSQAAAALRYYGGWADKNNGSVCEVDDSKFGYTRHEPMGVVGQIIPWNYPILMLSWKLGPALATGNTVVLKPSEFTPLTAIRVAHLIVEAGFPPGVVNICTGYGGTAGAAISAHMGIQKVAFTGSTLVGRMIMKAAAASNLKNVTLELGGKGPTIVLNDADLDQAVKWAAFGIYFNHGQTCCAGSRIFVQQSIYDEFMERFLLHVKTLQVGDPFHANTFQGPQVSKIQFDRIMGYIQKGKEEGATVALGGERHGSEGYFIQPTVFTDVNPSMTIMKDEIFGPVVSVQPFKDDSEILEHAHDTVYGLSAGVFSQDITRALRVAHSLHAGTVWINCFNQLNPQLPFGGYRQSGQYALANYTNVKAVHVNLSKAL